MEALPQHAWDPPHRYAPWPWPASMPRPPLLGS